MTSSADLRKQMRARRRVLSRAAQRAHARGLRANVLRTGYYRAARHVAVYLSRDGEIDPRHIVRALWQSGKHCYLPVLSGPYARAMMFAPYHAGSRLRHNRFAIGEPRSGRRQLRNGRQLDLILMPLVAFDDSGNRLGMGAGYYDRTLAHLARQRHWRKPKLVGLAHELQKVAALDAQPWDVPLNAVVTESAVYNCGGKRSKGGGG